MRNSNSKLNIFFKIILIFICLGICLVILADILNPRINSQMELINELIENRFYVYEKCTALAEIINTLDMDFELFIIDKDKDSVTLAEEKFKEKIHQKLDPRLKELETIITLPHLSEQEKSFVADICNGLHEYRRSGITLSSILRLGGSKASEVTIRTVRKTSSNIKYILAELMEYESNRIDEIKALLLYQLNNHMIFVLAIYIISIIMLLLISIFLIRSIIRSISRTKVPSMHSHD